MGLNLMSSLPWRSAFRWKWKENARQIGDEPRWHVSPRKDCQGLRGQRGSCPWGKLGELPGGRGGEAGLGPGPWNSSLDSCVSSRLADSTGLTEKEAGSPPMSLSPQEALGP